MGIIGPKKTTLKERIEAERQAETLEDRIRKLEKSLETLGKGLDAIARKHELIARKAELPVYKNIFKFCEHGSDTSYTLITRIGRIGPGHDISYARTGYDLLCFEHLEGYKQALTDYKSRKPHEFSSVDMLNNDYQQLLGCTLIHSPFRQKRNKEKAILYLSTPDCVFLRRFEVDFSTGDCEDPVTTDIPASLAFDPDTSKLFRKEAGNRKGKMRKAGDRNVYVVYNPGSSVKPDYLIVEVCRMLHGKYQDAQKLVRNGDCIVLNGKYNVGFCTGEDVPAAVADDMMRKHLANGKRVEN